MKKQLIPLARTLRSNQTEAEARLWGALWNRQPEGLKFRRQHSQQAGKDRQRTILLEDAKVLVLRFWNADVLQGLTGVIDDILSHIYIIRPITP